LDETSSSDDESDEKERLKRSRLSREEVQEFKIAFNMCAGAENSKSIHKDLIAELFLILGYSLGPSDVDK